MNGAALPVEATTDRFEARAIGAEPSIDRKGGRFGAGIIRGVALASVGEALGHEMWLDQQTIEQVTSYAQGKGVHGLKARFTHPGLSSDGMGRLLGRIHDVRTVGEKSVGDLHLSESAHDTPDGNLAEYVMMLTEEDPRAAGLSIVFHHDLVAEEEFSEAYTEDKFQSPDPKNIKHYRHVRLAELRAADVVDEPAANPDGLFDRSPLARQADEFLSYAAGISDKRPVQNAFSIDGDRATQFFNRWLTAHGLSIVPTTELSAMADNQTPEAPAAPEVTRESLLAEQSQFVDKFGTEHGVKWFTEGKTYEESLSLFCDLQSERINSLTESVKEAEEKLQSIDNGEPEPIETHPVESGSKSRFADHFKSQPSSN